MTPVAFVIIMGLYPRRYTVGPKVVQFYSRGCLRIFRVHVEHADELTVNPDGARGVLLTPNHTSFLDIAIMAALYPTVFVSKAEVRRYPILGYFTALTGTIFLDRESSGKRMRVINTLARHLPGKTVTVFPQGTVGKTSDRLPFHRGAFKVVEINPDIVIVPVTIVYREEERVYWVKGHSLWKTARLACALDRINIKIIVHKTVTAEDYKDRDATEISKMVEETVMAAAGSSDW